VTEQKPPDAMSRVPGYTFADTREQQEAQITVDSSYSSLCPDAVSRAPETGPVALEPGDLLQLRVFIDRGVVEVFVNGTQCIAVRVYPGREDSIGVSLRSQGRDAELKSLDAWQMANAYEPS